MNATLQRLVTASLVNLASNSAGIILALQNNLVSDLGGSLHGENVYRDFLTTRGTALSAPVPFMVAQLALTVLALRAGRARRIGTAGLSFVGLLYTLAQSGERIIFRLLSPGGFDLLQAIVFLVNVATAVAMLAFGILAWRATRTIKPAASSA